MSFSQPHAPQPSLDDELSMDWPPPTDAAGQAHAVYNHADYAGAHAGVGSRSHSRGDSSSRDHQPAARVYDYGYGNAAGATVVAPSAAAAAPLSSASPLRLPAAAPSSLSGAVGGGGGSDDSRAELKQLKRLIRKQHAEHEAATQSMRVALEVEQARVATLESEASARRQELARAAKEVDRLTTAEQDARKRITKLQAACNDLEERAADAEARSKANKGWFGGIGMGSSLLTGGGVTPASSSSSSEAHARSKAGPAFKQLQADMETLQGELLAKIAENQSLHTAASDTAKEHANLVQTLQHKIEEGRGRLRESEEEKKALGAQLAREREEAAARETALSARVAALSTQVSSTLSSSSAADQAWLVQRAQYERVFSALKRVWFARVPFDDASRPDLRAMGLDLALRQRWSRAATEVQARAAGDVRTCAEKIAALLNNQLLKHWIDKWSIQQQQQQQHPHQHHSGGGAPTGPSAAHLASLQGLAAQLVQKMSDMTGGLDQVVGALHRVAGVPLPTKANVPASASASTSASASASTALVQSPSTHPPLPRSSPLHSFTLLLEPLCSALHLLAQLCALQAQLLVDPAQHNHASGGGGGGGIGGGGPGGAVGGHHVAQLAFAWKQLQSHLNKGASALKLLMERGGNASASPATGVRNDAPPPPNIALVLPSTALSSSFTLPAAWVVEWLLHSPASGAGAAGATGAHQHEHDHDHASPPPPPPHAFAATHVHAYLSTLQALLGDVSTKFAIVSVHEYRQQPSASASGGGGHDGSDTAASAIHRSRLSELNNRLLIDLKTLPKLVETLANKIDARRNQADALRHRERLAESQSFQQQHARAAAITKNEKIKPSRTDAPEADEDAESEDDAPAVDLLDESSNPFAVYLRPNTAAPSAGAAGGAPSSISRSLVSLHTRATSFLSSLNSCTLRTRSQVGLPYSMALQQRFDLGQLSRDFALLSARYRELEQEHHDLSTRHQLLSDEHQAALERSEAQHDTFAQTQLDYFEEKRLREVERRSTQGALAQLAESEAALRVARAQLDEQAEEVKRLQAQLEGGWAFDQQSPEMRPLHHPRSAPTPLPGPSNEPAEQQQQQQQHEHAEHVDAELDFEPTSSHARTLDELLEADGDAVTVLDVPRDAAGSLLHSSLTVAAATGAAPVHHSFLPGHGSDPDVSDTGAEPPRRNDVSDWLRQAKQFEQVSREQMERAQRAPLQRCGASYSIDTAGEQVYISGTGVAATAAPPATAAASSFLPASAFSTPIASRRPHPAAGSIDAAVSLPSLLDDSFASGASGDVTVHQLDEQLVAGSSDTERSTQLQVHLRDASSSSPSTALAVPAVAAPSVSSWQLYQHRSRLHAAESELQRVSRHVSVLHARNSGLVLQLSRAHHLLQLLSSRASLARATAAATLGRLQEVQMERSEQMHTYTGMMDELTERIFQLTQQLADKDARAA